MFIISYYIASTSIFLFLFQIIQAEWIIYSGDLPLLNKKKKSQLVCCFNLIQSKQISRDFKMNFHNISCNSSFIHNLLRNYKPLTILDFHNIFIEIINQIDNQIRSILTSKCVYLLNTPTSLYFTTHTR